MFSDHLALKTLVCSCMPKSYEVQNFDDDLTAVASVCTQLFVLARNLRPFSDSIEGFLGSEFNFRLEYFSSKIVDFIKA